MQAHADFLPRRENSDKHKKTQTHTIALASPKTRSYVLGVLTIPTCSELEDAAHSIRISMRRICLEAGVSPTVYYRWRRLKCSPRAVTVQKLIFVINKKLDGGRTALG
jgi:hypothetical protein